MINLIDHHICNVYGASASHVNPGKNIARPLKVQDLHFPVEITGPMHHMRYKVELLFAEHSSNLMMESMPEGLSEDLTLKPDHTSLFL